MREVVLILVGNGQGRQEELIPTIKFHKMCFVPVLHFNSMGLSMGHQLHTDESPVGRTYGNAAFIPHKIVTASPQQPASAFLNLESPSTRQNCLHLTIIAFTGNWNLGLQLWRRPSWITLIHINPMEFSHVSMLHFNSTEFSMLKFCPKLESFDNPWFPLQITWNGIQLARKIFLTIFEHQISHL